MSPPQHIITYRAPMEKCTVLCIFIREPLPRKVTQMWISYLPATAPDLNLSHTIIGGQIYRVA